MMARPVLKVDHSTARWLFLRVRAHVTQKNRRYLTLVDSQEPEKAKQQAIANGPTD